MLGMSYTTVSNTQTISCFQIFSVLQPYTYPNFFHLLVNVFALLVFFTLMHKTYPIIIRVMAIK